MSTLKTGALRGTSGTADSVQLHASNQSVTFPGAVTVTGALTSSTTGLGKVLQAVSATTQTETQASNQSWETCSAPQPVITPSSASSKILVIVSSWCNTRNVVNCAQKLQRVVGGSATDLVVNWSESADDNWVPMNAATTYLDSPNTTSAVTYRVQIWAHQNASSYRWNYDSGETEEATASIICLEIGA